MNDRVIATCFSHLGVCEKKGFECTVVVVVVVDVFAGVCCVCVW